MKSLLLVIQSNTQKDHFRTTLNRLKAQLSLTLVRRWDRFLGKNCLLTNDLFWCIYFHLNDLCHLGRLAQMDRAPARQAGGRQFKSDNAQCFFSL